VEVLGVLFLLLPFSIAVAWLSLDYVALSWRITERSGSTGGLAGLYLAKSLLPLGAALLALQGLAEALRAWPTAFDHSAAEAA
jgi:TRAP-type mannitol/chloroaromatic compound transport system permease small subunit